MDFYTQAWIALIAMFGVVEGMAIFNWRKGDTFTEHVQKWFSIKDKGTGWLLRRGGLAVFLGWLLLHLMDWG